MWNPFIHLILFFFCFSAGLFLFHHDIFIRVLVEMNEVANNLRKLQEGEFWRILLPGIYTMEVFAEGYAPREVQFAIVEQNPTILNITLYKVSRPQQGIYGVCDCVSLKTWF